MWSNFWQLPFRGTKNIDVCTVNPPALNENLQQQRHCGHFTTADPEPGTAHHWLPAQTSSTDLQHGLPAQIPGQIPARTSGSKSHNGPLAQSFSMDIWHRHLLQICVRDIQHGPPAWTSGTDFQHTDFPNRLSARISNTDFLHRSLAYTFSTGSGHNLRELMWIMGAYSTLVILQL